MGHLRGEGIVRVFSDGTRALDGVDFDAHPGRVLTLLGPSGCGKSTLLRIVAGLERPCAGRLVLDGRPIDDLPPGRRDVGFVFQNYALYPHLTVARNLSLALEVRRQPRALIDARVRETAALLGIETLLARRPAQLSGGQQQRVALGRALARRPALYLLDEPLSNLDALLRESMRSELKALFARLGATVIYVTHDQAEAMSLSDDVAVMRAGRIIQCASPLEVYARPCDVFVATFVGSPRMTLWRCRRQRGEAVFLHLERDDRVGPRAPLPFAMAEDETMVAGIRPEDVELSKDRDGWEAQVDLAEPMGADVLLTLRIGDLPLRALVRVKNWPKRLHVRWPAERIHWYDARSGKRVDRRS
jgi:multiple sugar transport system ATP-binding protein